MNSRTIKSEKQLISRDNKNLENQLNLEDTEMANIKTSAAELIGKTPLLEVKKFEAKENITDAKILAKLEYFNPAGSVKDRVALKMIEDAEESGKLKPGATIIEPTSGNTGIGIAAVAAAKGYKVIITIPETMSVERRNIMKAYGAELVLTEGVKGMKGAIAKADEIKEAVSYPLLDELPEYVPADNAAGRMKLTVSQLKAMQADDDSEENAYMDESVKAALKKEADDEQTDSEAMVELSNSIIPKFISGKEEKLAANERGSAYHRVMECLDYSVSVNLDGVKADINRMLETGKMNELQVKSVNPWDIYTFVQSDTGRRVANAMNCGSVRREQPFVFEYEGQLIQGIIDLCFEEDGELVIVDYKTDRVMKGKAGEKELVKRYAIQLDYYAKALAQLTGKTVKEKIIYSFALEKEIMC